MAKTFCTSISHTHSVQYTQDHLHFAHALKDVDIIIGCTNIGTILTHVRYDKSGDADDLIKILHIYRRKM